MKGLFSKNKFESGQVIPLVVLMMFAIIGMVALILDGGSVMSNRRTAQAAADAGALAGAKEICSGHSENAITTANLYVTNNHALPSNQSILTDAAGHPQGVSITATTTNASFFAKIFGAQTLPAKAKAAAGCYSVSQAKVLPIAWACKKPVGESDSPDCQLNLLDWKTEMTPLISGNPNPVKIHDLTTADPSHNITCDSNGCYAKTPLNFSQNYLPKFIYVIMDSPKIDDDTFYTCADPTIPLSSQSGKIDCDLNNDGINDVMGHGERSWLDLEGGLPSAGESGTPPVDNSGAAALKSWIKGDGVPTLAIHTWLGGQSGVASSIFRTVNTYVVGKVALVPVFDGICDTNPDSKPSCIPPVHAAEVPAYTGTDHEPIRVSPGADYYYHIIGFAAFYVTCVDDGGGANKCPAAVQMINDNTAAGGPWEGKKGQIKIKSIEGYFISDYPFDLGNPGTGGVDVGVHVVSLSQ